MARALTGAVLKFGYGGLPLVPLAFAALSRVTSMTTAFGSVSPPPVRPAPRASMAR